MPGRFAFLPCKFSAARLDQPQDLDQTLIAEGRTNVPILEIRKDSIEKILHGTISTLAKPAKPNKDDDDDGGVVGDPTSRSSLC